MVAVVFLLIGGLFGLSVALTRWPTVHLLPADWFYLALTAHGLDVLLVWIIFFEMAVLYFGATTNSLGGVASFDRTPTSWDDPTGAFKNLASADGGGNDRALGIRQVFDPPFGDPGAAFVLHIANTSGFENFTLSLTLQILDVQDRSTTWTIDYRVGNVGNFTQLGTYGDPNSVGSTPFSSSALSDWNDKSSEIWFRIVSLGGMTGTGNLGDTFAIDDFSLTFSPVAPVPEPAHWGLICVVDLLGVCGLHTWCERWRSQRLMRNAS